MCQVSDKGLEKQGRIVMVVLLGYTEFPQILLRESYCIYTDHAFQSNYQNLQFQNPLCSSSTLYYNKLELQLMLCQDAKDSLRWDIVDTASSEHNQNSPFGHWGPAHVVNNWEPPITWYSISTLFYFN